jgi:hypothetical protein
VLLRGARWRRGVTNNQDLSGVMAISAAIARNASLTSITVSGGRFASQPVAGGAGMAAGEYAGRGLGPRGVILVCGLLRMV